MSEKKDDNITEKEKKENSKEQLIKKRSDNQDESPQRENTDNKSEGK